MVVSVNRLNVQLNQYDTIDSSLMASREYVRQFGTPEDYVEYHIYTKSGDLILSDYDYKGYKVPDTLQGSTDTYTQELEFDPGVLLENLGFTFGTYDVQFNIYRKKIFNTNQKVFFIKEISSDRTEIRISSNLISSQDIETGTLNFLYEIQSSPYFKDFLLNFGDNLLINGINVALDRNTDPYSILIKLYQPLPDQLGEKDSFWFVEELSEAPVYEVVLEPTPIPEQVPFLSGPNFDINVDEFSIKPSDYVNINGLLSNQSLNAYQQLYNAISQKGIQINVDYSDYSNFVHFSSAKERLLNFRYKIQLIEAYQSDISSIRTTTNYNTATNSSSSIYVLQNKIDNLIKNFDGYESYLYYASESAAWPKSGSAKPYSLYAVTSSQVTNWLGNDDYNASNYGGQLSTASAYDLENQDNLSYTVPEYISVDPVNDQYTLFLNMVGQHFDNIYIYVKAITDLSRANSSLTKGISKDMVYNALRSLGLKLYNSKSNENLFEYLIGSTASGSYAPTGSQYDTLVSASAESIPGQDIQKETLKRIYHNLPLLLKSRGTERGVKALITSFGIPDTILNVNEYGGQDKIADTVDYTYNRFSYALNMSGSYVQTYWGARYDYPTGSVTDYVPTAVEFRFKPDKDYYYTTASLFTLISTYVITAYADMSPDTSRGYPYSNVNFYLKGNQGYAKASVSLPIYMTGSGGEEMWWNFLVQKRNDVSLLNYSANQYYDLYVKNKIDTRIGHQASSSIFVNGAVSSSYNVSWNTVTQSFYLNMSPTFVGYAQELRYWTTNLSESVFNYHVLNPESIRGNDSGSAYAYLSARYPLGNDLYTYNHSLTGSVFSVQPNYYERSRISGAFIKSASFFSFPNQNNYVSNDELYVADSPLGVYSTPVTEKVRIVENAITGSVLSSFIRMEDVSGQNRTNDVNFIDVSFSPSNEIDKDIIAQFGSSLNIDSLIGDPRDKYTDTYPDLEIFKDEYFRKYNSRYNLKDYIRLIKFFDNSLFKMIKDYVPVRSEVHTGLTIKSPIIERNKAKQPHPIMEIENGAVNGAIFSGEIEADSIYRSGYGDGSDFFIGVLSGSSINVERDFEEKNANPYVLFTGSVNQAEFDRSNYNTLINVVTESVYSTRFMKLNPYQPGVSESVQIDDGLYEDPAFTNIRYNGSKVNSAYYNVYTSASNFSKQGDVIIWPGDNSYGKTAAVDINVNKFGFSNNIIEYPVNFYDKTTINLKYLIDATGSTKELSSANNNIFEIQSMYKKGDKVTVSLFDKYNPSNQSSLDGDHEIFEGGFRYSPLLYRETNETLYFTYDSPNLVTTARLGAKAVNTSSLVWQTVGDTNGEFDDLANGTTNIFKVNGVSNTTIPLSLSKNASTSWPYLRIPLTDYALYPYLGWSLTLGSGYILVPTGIEEQDTAADDPAYYSIDWFIPNATASANGGYATNDMKGLEGTVKTAGEYYSYIEAPRSSSFIANIDIPIKIKAKNRETFFERGNEKGPSIVKIIGILEVQKNGGSSWNYINPQNGETYGYTVFKATNIPFATGGRSSTGTTKALVNEDGSYLYFPEETTSGTAYGKYISPYFEGRCQLLNKEIDLDQGDKVRVKLYFAEVTTFFRRSEDIYFELALGDSSKAYFELYDKNLSSVTTVVTGSITSANPLFTKEGDNRTLTFNDSASLFYDRATFDEPDPNNPNSLAYKYSHVDLAFKPQIGDIFRFTTYYSKNPEYFLVQTVIPPVIIEVGTSLIVQRSLQVVLNKTFNPSQVSVATFALFRRLPDETTVIINFSKRPGLSSNALLIPNNLLPDTRKNVAEIIAPIKDTLLSKVLVIG